MTKYSMCTLTAGAPIWHAFQKQLKINSHTFYILLLFIAAAGAFPRSISATIMKH